MQMSNIVPISGGQAIVPAPATEFEAEIEFLAQEIEQLAGGAGMQIAARLKKAHDKFAYQRDEGLGGFTGWVRKRLGYSVATAYRLIQAHDRFGESLSIWQTLPRSALYLLAAPGTPEKAIAEVVQRIEAGEKPTVGEVEVAIARAGAPESGKTVNGNDVDPEEFADEMRASQAGLAGDNDHAGGEEGAAELIETPAAKPEADDGGAEAAGEEGAAEETEPPADKPKPPGKPKSSRKPKPPKPFAKIIDVTVSSVRDHITQTVDFLKNRNAPPTVFDRLFAELDDIVNGAKKAAEDDAEEDDAEEDDAETSAAERRGLYARTED